MWLTRLAVHRPVTTLMACCIVVLLGGISLTELPVDLMPDMESPTVSVTTLYKGAGPEEVEHLLTRPLEQRLSSVSGVERLASSTTEGASNIRVQLRWGTDINAAIADMRQSMQRLLTTFPDEVEGPEIRHYDIQDRPIIYIGLTSDVDELKLTEIAEQSIIPRLDEIPGVARVGLRGAARREIHVNLDRAKLEALHLSVGDIVAALREGNINQPAGDLEQGNMNILIRSHGEFASLDEIENTVVLRNQGAAVRLRDIAEVSDSQEERTELTRVDGRTAVLLYIFKQSGANTISVSDQVREAIEEINESAADNTQLKIRFDQSDFIRNAIANVRTSAVYGMGLAIIVLVLFLRSFRSTLVIAVSMPLSVLATFVLIHLQGFTLNMISFGGLALGIGMLVDNSIVVLESIFRKAEAGQNASTAAIEGTREVASAIIASTVTTMIVFLPLIFVTGVTSVMLHQLAWVVCFSLVCSLIASLTLTPSLAAHWIASRAGEEVGYFGRLVRAFHGMNQAILETIETVYLTVLRTSLRFRGLVGFALITLFFCTVGLFPRIGTEFLPQADEGSLRVTASMAPGIQLETLDRQTKEIERAIDSMVPERVVSTVFIGGDADDADEWNESSFRISLTPRHERQRDVDEIRKALADELESIAGMKIRAQSSSNMPIFRMLSTGSGDIAVEIRGHDLVAAEQLADEVSRVMKEVAGLINVKIEKEPKRPELAALIDRDKASALGVRISDMTQTLETTIRGTDATRYRDRGNEYNVLVRLRESDRNRSSDLELVSVPTPGGRVVPLKNLMRFDVGEAPIEIDRLDQQRVLAISADVEDRDLGSTVRDLQAGLKTIPLPDGFSLKVAGSYEQQQESFAELTQGFVLAVVLMYMVMASQFESLLDPLLILITVPLGAIGVILVLVGTETTLNVQSFIGIVMLAGIVVNNAIVLLDYYRQLCREEPETRTLELVLRAASRRFRPIVMTTLTTILAMVPIAFGWGEGGELQAPMARVVIGGLLSGTLITLLALPLTCLLVGRNRGAATNS